MITSKQQLKQYIELDSFNYKAVIGWHRWRNRLKANPISDQWYIWDYLKTLRYCEYHINCDGILHKLMRVWYLHKLRSLSRITGFQIPPNTVGEGLTIWHWGTIIINPKVKIGKNCTLYPGVLIGHKEEGQPAPVIGNNVFICSGAKIIGNVHIGNNVVIGHNCVVTHDIPDNTKVVVNKTNRFLG